MIKIDMKIFIVNQSVCMHHNENVYMNNELSKEAVEEVKNLSIEFSKSENQDEAIIEKIISIIQPKENIKVLGEIQQKTVDLNDQKIKLSKHKKLISNEEFNTFFDYNIKTHFFTLKNNTVSLPGMLLDIMYVNIENGISITPFVNFWKLALNNINPDSRDGAIKFVKNQKLIVTPNGHVVCYRRSGVLSGEIDETTKYVQSECIRIRAMKCGLKRYHVVKINGVYSTIDERTKAYEKCDKSNILGNLSDLEKSSNGRSNLLLTDNHTKTMRYTIGDVVSIPRSVCDEDPNKTCSNGLHIGSLDFIKNNSYFGQKILLCLVNPMNIVSVPYSDAHKMRVCEYKIIAAFDTSSEIEDFENKDIRVFENNYLDYQLSKIEQTLVNKDFGDENYSCVIDIQNLENEINKMKSTISTNKTSSLKEYKKYQNLISK